MKLLAKFSLIFTLVMGTGLAITAWLTYQRLQQDARAEVSDQAHLMMAAMSSVRNYTNDQLTPLLNRLQQRERAFLPQSIPGFAATQNFHYLRARYPEYTYKEASLNPTNPTDRAIEWEADVVNSFRNQASLDQLTGERDSPTGRSLYFAQPLRASQPCLECHSVAARAPAPMLAMYGSVNGFGWRAGDVIAAQIVSVPMSVPLGMASRAFRELLTYLALVFVLSLVVLNLTLYLTIARPVGRLSHMADEISLGKMDVPELPIEGRDEISQLAGSFNRMRRSLITAMKMLDEQ